MGTRDTNQASAGEPGFLPTPISKGHSFEDPEQTYSISGVTSVQDVSRS